MATHAGLENKVLAAFAATVLVVAVLAVATWKLSRDATGAGRWVAHTAEVVNAIASVRADAYLVESSTRGFLISGNAAELATRDATISTRDATLLRIRELTADNPAQQKRWVDLRAVADERAAISRRSTLLRQTEGFDAARAYGASAPVRETRERYAQVLREMEDEERRLLGARRAEQSAARDVAVATGAALALLLTALLAATYFAIRRQVRETAASHRALAASEQSLATTLNSIGDAVLATDTQGCVTRMNPVAERLTGWTPVEARGRPIDEVFRIINEQTRAPAVVPVARVLASGEVHGLANHTVLIARDGTEWPIADSAAPIRDAGGRVTGVVLVFRDQTDARRAEQVIQQQNALLERRVNERTAQLRANRLRLIIESVKDYAILMLDPAGRIVSSNATTQQIKGYAAAELIGRHFSCFYPAADVASGKPDAELAIAARDGRFEDEALRLRRDGSTFWADVVITPMRDPAGALLGFAKVSRDITERKRAEHEILELNASLERRVAERTRQLEDASRAKSEFLANMSHELRTPLNAIIGFSEMLKDGVLGELEAKQRGFVTDILDAGTHLLALINDILDLSKVESGAMRLESRAVDIAALLQASTLVVKEKALAQRIRLNVQLDSTLGHPMADERKLKQIVYNLLANAVKFTPAGGTVTLRAGRCARDDVALDAALPGRLIALPPGADAEFLAITVEDTGAGIAETDLHRLFEPFMQVDGSVARSHAGTGLGLSLVRRLTQLHGGTVGVVSRLGGGSRFHVWLPYRAGASEAPANGSSPEPAVPRPSAMPLALVIEDDDWMADLIAGQLRAEGYEVMRAATAEEGLVRAAKSRPQMITLDIFLPSMDGWEFLQRLKADPALADTPVVIITISADLERGIALGARRVLQKPFARRELITVLSGLVDKRHDGEPSRILVVDDNVQAVELLATTLESEGYGVLRAYGGAEAIAAARAAPPDLVILDLMMPEVSGFEVAHALREFEGTARIPILVLTAKDLNAEDHARLNGAVSTILEKSSFSRGELLAELRRAIASRGRTGDR